VTQGLAELTRAELLLRADQPVRRGLRVRLTGLAMGESQSRRGTRPPQRSVRGEEAPRAAESDGRGVTVEIGGASISVPAGSRLQLPTGMDYRLEIGPDGDAIIRIDD
jgi:hypothetical protein